MDIRRALISVYDKTGVAELGRALAEAGVELLSTGGTARVLREAGLAVVDVSEFTGSPERMGGRVKTLHPRVHGGILARRAIEGDLTDLKALGGAPIDLVAVNLYPFRQTVAGGADAAEALEQIDIGGPTLLRAAAKNHADVLVLCDPADYGLVGQGQPEEQLEGWRRRLAAKAFAHTAAYDSDVAQWLGALDAEFPLDAPAQWSVAGRRHMALRYGENPHQPAAFYATGVTDTGLAAADVLQGKALSYNNLLDADGCLRMVEDLAHRDDLSEGEQPAPACVIVKHTNPCGVALADSAAQAFEQARSCDPVSFFGGIVGFNVAVDAAAARALVEHFLEVIVAPEFTPEALQVLAAKKRLRLLRLAPGTLQTVRDETEVRRVRGGLIVQSPDAGPLALEAAEVATERAPTAQERAALTLAWRMCRHVKSNAIVFADERRLVGVGAGQMSRVDAAKLAVDRAVLPLRGSVAASDAFFPFRDGLDVIAAAGATAVVQPGGSRNDAEVIAAANEHGMAMLMTGQRHFRH